MELEVGSILEGRVSTITKFGAFVSLPDNRSGLVHISEIANHYVEDVSAHLQMGQTVKVKVLSISPEGKISLSIKKALPPAPRPNYGGEKESGGSRSRSNGGAHNGSRSSAAAAPLTPEAAFEDKLKQFMSASDSKISDLNRYMDARRGGRRRK